MPFNASLRSSFGPQGRFNRGSKTILTNPTAYPSNTGNFQLFSTGWDANDTNLLSASHAASTFTVPAGVGSLRVLVWGGGATQTNDIGGGAGNGGFIDTIIEVTPGEKYKAIVASGATATGSYQQPGGSGVGGGASQDGNDIGSGGAGSGFFYAFDAGNNIVTTEAQMFSKGCLVAGGGGTGSGHGMGGSQSNITFSGVNGVGRDGARGGNSGGFGGLASGQGGSSVNDAAGNPLRTGGTDGVGGQYAQDAYGGSYGCGSGGGRGAGGGSSGQGSSGTNGENATGTGGRGGKAGSGFQSTGFGRSEFGPGNGGNGSIFNGIRLGGGGGGSHGSPAGGGGWSGGGAAYCCSSQGGGGGSGAAFGSIITPTLSGWVSSSSVSVNGGNANSVCGVATTAGLGRASYSGTGYTGAILVMW